MELAIENTRIRIHFEYSKPIAINDFTKSMNAIGTLYKNFANQNSTQEIAECGLYVEKIKEGSLDMFLMSTVSCVIPMMEGFNTVAEFGKYMIEYLSFFAKGLGSKPDTTKEEAIESKNLLDMSVNDEKSTMTISITNANGNIYNNCTFVMNSNECNSAQNRLNTTINELNKKEQESSIAGQKYERVLLVMKQSRADQNKKNKRNRGIIDMIEADIERPIFFDSDTIRDEMLHSDINPFNVIYQVDVEVQSANKTIVYCVTKLHSIEEIDN